MNTPVRIEFSKFMYCDIGLHPLSIVGLERQRHQYRMERERSQGEHGIPQTIGRGYAVKAP